MGRLNGKVALISGGSMGQGREEVSLFCEEGAKVVFGDIRDKEGYLLEKELRVQGFDVTYFHLDVTKESDWKNAVAKTVELHTNLDILINNAGIYFRKGLEETTEELTKGEYSKDKAKKMLKSICTTEKIKPD